MQNDEITLDVQEEQKENEPVTEEETTLEDTEFLLEEDTEPEVEKKVALSPSELRHFRKWKREQSQPQSKVATQPQVSPQLNVEETVLLANGMPEELIAQLKKVAKVQDTSLIKAQSDPIFVAIKEKFEKDKKQKDASLPASRGSGAAKVKKDVTTPGLSREEHMALAREALSR